MELETYTEASEHKIIAQNQIKGKKVYNTLPEVVNSRAKIS